MIYYKTDEEIELMRESNLLVSKTLGYIVQFLKVGTIASEIDKKAEEFILDNGGKPAFKGYKSFPATLCMSVNDSVVHGIPNSRNFISTDIVSIDGGVYLNGYFGDSAYTFAFNDVDSKTLQLLKVTKESLQIGINEATIGNRIGDISFAIQNYCEKVNNYGIVRELVGHGVGRNLHESPEVPNFGFKGKGPIIKEGLVIAIEPMVNMGSRAVKQHNDGWTISTRDGMPSAHFEHSIAIRKNGPDILSTHEFIEIAIKNNAELLEIS